MATCEELIGRARTLIWTSTGTFAGVAVAIATAAALNAGFFSAATAPTPMGVAAVLAASTAATLTAALLALNQWGARDDCMYLVCAPNLDRIRTALIAAIASVTALAATCAEIAGFAWIPFVAQIPMWAAYATAGATAASLAALVPLWDALTYCQIDGPIASQTSHLEPGEKKGDRWFLRLTPASGADFAQASKTSARGDDGLTLSNPYLDCTLRNVQEWQVAATATIYGGPSLPVQFAWKFAGTDVTGSSAPGGATVSNIVLKSAPLAAPALLEVTATDAAGYSRTKQAEISLGDLDMKCHLILHFIPEWKQIPTEPPGPVEINLKIQALLDLARKVPLAPQPGRSGIR